jgi:capsid protein
MIDPTSSFVIDSRGVTPTLAASTGATKFSSSGSPAGNYDAIKPNGKRRQPSSMIVREDAMLRAQQRNQLSANAADLARNFSIAAWMIRRHLDYVASFRFNVKTGDETLDAKIDTFIETQSIAANCDRGERLPREKLFRLCETRRVVDGDVGLLRLRSRQVQVVESDLVRNPDNAKTSDEWENGVSIDRAGAQKLYSVSRRMRGGRGYEWQRNVPRQNFRLYGFFERDAANQVRGVSPVAAGINDFRDIYEGLDYAKSKNKIGQLFAAAITRKPGSTSLEKTLNGEDDDQTDEPRVIDLTKGPIVFDLDDDEGVEIIESASPSGDFRGFMQMEIAIALKSLDIPYNFFDESFTNYSGSRGAWLLYDRACTDKRNDQIDLRREWVYWVVSTAVADGVLELPAGMTAWDVAYRFTQWVPRGMPWWKPSEEVTGTLKAIGGGLDNPERACQEADRGDVYQNIDATIRVMKYARDEGEKHLGEPLKLSFEAEFPNTTEVVTANG